ncbi:hypothetical protein KM043_010346 [Ampulex compressa]|nr:hypothetical protein KM043_010346 [Ampulex compressa]
MEGARRGMEVGESLRARRKVPSADSLKISLLARPLPVQGARRTEGSFRIINIRRRTRAPPPFNFFIRSSCAALPAVGESFDFAAGIVRRRKQP